MKLYTGIYIILGSLVMTTIGSVLKIQHSGSSDLYLAIGVISFIIGVAIVLYRLLKNKVI